MPAGVSWPRYLSFFTAAMLSMFAGSQTVHYYYKPLDDLNDLIEQELKRRSGPT
ncbi:protein brawnin [Athalia rosae]|uniref:protein brawnin n=1 Tax=Athalia rosae TaxID=37344 RepID=UPI0020332974|nr:protein brawnin [Athalia rosae]